MSIEGTLGELRLQEVLQAVAQKRRTGILTVQSETTIVAISFLDGAVVSADSLAHTVEERLGAGLVEDGLVERSAVAELARRQDAGEGRLVDLLVDDGQLTRDEVLAALWRQNRALLTELLDWGEGEFKFYGGDEVAYEEGIEPLRIDQFLLETLDGEETTEAEPFSAHEEAVIDDGPAAEEPWDAGWPAAPQEVVEVPDVVSPADGDVAPEAPAAATGPTKETPAASDAGGGIGPGPVAAPTAAAPPVARRPPVAPAPMAVAPSHHPRRWATALALLLSVGLAAAAAMAPAAALAPLPWQRSEHRAVVEVQRLADRLAVDRAAKTYFLLEGHFPDRLEQLIDLGLLDAEDRVGPEGRRLTLVAGEESYDILVVGEDEPLWSEAISGNFLLDPDLYVSARTAAASSEAPLVLLD